MKHTLKTILLTSTFAVFNLFAQAADDVRSIDQINLAYTGDDSRLGIGINEDGEFITDFLKSFNSTYRSNGMFQGWY
ncbi:MAG: hypothetical protein L3J53_07700 [Proteobacteria bacterium]|nr:hypothetical protein [Pseudomonadota bacterium]